jgi:hypothetical protein
MPRHFLVASAEPSRQRGFTLVQVVCIFIQPEQNLLAWPQMPQRFNFIMIEVT